MGLLKKLQDANSDDETSDGLGVDGDFVSMIDPALDSAATVPDLIVGDESNKAKDAEDKKESDKVTDEKIPVHDPEFVPAEVVKLEQMLRSFDFWYGSSDDESVRRDGEADYAAIVVQIERCEADGCLEDARKIWDKYAPKECSIPDVFFNKQFYSNPNVSPGPGLPARRPGEPFSEPYNRRLYTRPFVDATSNAGSDQHLPSSKQQVDQERQSNGGGVQSDLLTKALTAPFSVMAAAGSLIANGFNFTGDKLRGFYVKGRENGHIIMGKQLDEAAGNIVSLTDSLKQQGMGAIIADMKATGRPAREIFQGMMPGGPHQHFGDRFSALMKNESFAQQYAKLEDALSDFGFKASHYAQTGIELGRDYSEAIERNLEKVSAVTEGFIFKKDGVIKHLQELARSISDTISNMINNLLGRNKPQPQ